MATTASNHGGDDGANPPPHSTTIPTSCQSAPIKMRGGNKSMNLEKLFRANKCKPLPIEFDIEGETYYAIGDLAPLFSRWVSNLVRFNIPPYYKSWDRVPVENRAKVLIGVDDYFDIQKKKYEEYEEGPYHLSKILDGIDRLAADRYRGWKSSLHTHFKKNGGQEADLNKALANVPPRVNEEAWKKCIDELYTDDKWKKRAAQNTLNREQNQCPSLHGAQSISQGRHKLTNQATGKRPNIIETYRRLHYKEGSGWVHETAEEKYNKLREMAATQEQAHSVVSSTMDSSDSQAYSAPPIVDEKEIVQAVLGSHRDHQTGVGRKLKGTSKNSTPGTSSSTVQYPRQNPQQLPDNQDLREEIAELRAIIAAALPHVNLPPPRSNNTRSTAPPPTQQSPPSGVDSSPQNNNDNAHDLGDN